MPVGGKMGAVCRTGRDSRSGSLERMVRRFVHLGRSFGMSFVRITLPAGVVVGLIGCGVKLMGDVEVEILQSNVNLLSRRLKESEGPLPWASLVAASITMSHSESGNSDCTASRNSSGL